MKQESMWDIDIADLEEKKTLEVETSETMTEESAPDTGWHIELNQGELQYDVPAGYRVRTDASGREIAQAYAYVETDRLHEWFSEEYELVRAADVQIGASRSGVHAVREYGHDAAVERAVAAALARSRMTENQRSPLDMKKIAADLQFEAASEQRRWNILQEKQALVRKHTQDTVTLLLGIELQYVSAEQRDALSALLKALVGV